jgi:hypothetical protein
MESANDIDDDFRDGAGSIADLDQSFRDDCEQGPLHAGLVTDRLSPGPRRQTLRTDGHSVSIKQQDAADHNQNYRRNVSRQSEELQPLPARFQGG